MRWHNPELTDRAQGLRKLKNATRQEKRLWYDFLRNYRPPFRRQVIIQQYIVDFYCSRVKLVVEVDGSQHYEEKAEDYDRKRTEILKDLGCHVIRYRNSDIVCQFQSVCEDIDHRVQLLLMAENRQRTSSAAADCIDGDLASPEGKD